MPGHRSVLHLLASDERRGAETFGAVLADELRDRGWSCDVRAVRASQRPGNHAVRPLGEAWGDPRGLAAYVRLARRHDVVVAHGSSTLWTAGLGSAIGGPPFVYVNIGDPLFWSSTRARRLRVRALLTRAAGVAAISPRAARSLTEHLGVPPERVRVIPNGRSTERFAPPDATGRAALREAFDLPVAVPVVAYVGALSAEKHPELAVQAVSRLRGAHLVVAGDGPLRAELERLAASVMPGRAHWLGSVRRPEDVLAAADVLLLTSRSEGVPGVLIEAGLTGIPSVTTDVGYTSDVVLDGVTGRVVDTLDAPPLTAALTEALAERAAWGAAARCHCAATYGLPAVVDKWEVLLREVVA